MKIVSIDLNKEKGTCVLAIDPEFLNGLPKQVVEYSNANSFRSQNNLHMTLFGYKQGKRISDFVSTIAAPQREAYWQKLESIITEFRFDIKETGDFFHIKRNYEFFIGSPDNKVKEERESIVEVLSVPDIKSLFEKISALGVAIEIPFPHITLFLKNDSQAHGIGVVSKDDLLNMMIKKVFSYPKEIKKIAVATKLQTDTVAAIFLLKKFGDDLFPNINSAPIEILSIAPDNSENQLEAEGVLLIDIGKGRLDHHGRSKKTTTSKLVAQELGIINHPSIQKLLRFVERDEFYGKGIVSEDILDKAFGFPSFVVNLGKMYQNDPQKVFEAIVPILEAHFVEENKRKLELPKLLNDLTEDGKVSNLIVRHRSEDLKVVFVESDDLSLPGYLRAKEGGQFDIVVAVLSSGHKNVLTKNIKKIDLRSLAALVRKSEAILANKDVGDDMASLSVSGRMEEIPQWYYDPVTNSLQNGGINPQGVEPTKISKQSMIEIVKIGLAESLWKPGNEQV